MASIGYAVTLGYGGLTAEVTFSDGEMITVPRWDACTENVFYLVRDSWDFSPTASFTGGALVVGVKNNTIHLYGPHACKVRDICPTQIEHYKDFARFMMAVMKNYAVVLIVDSASRLPSERFLIHKAFSDYDNRAQLYPMFTMDCELYAGYSGLPGNLVAFEDEQVRELAKSNKIYSVYVDNTCVLCSSRPAFIRGENRTFLFDRGAYMCLMTNCSHKDFELSWLEQVKEVAYSYNNGVQIFIMDEDVLKKLVEENDLQHVSVNVLPNAGHKYDWSKIFVPTTDTLREYFIKYNIAAENEAGEITRLHSLFGTESEADLRKEITALL